MKRRTGEKVSHFFTSFHKSDFGFANPSWGLYQNLHEFNFIPVEREFIVLRGSKSLLELFLYLIRYS